MAFKEHTSFRTIYISHWAHKIYDAFTLIGYVTLRIAHNDNLHKLLHIEIGTSNILVKALKFWWDSYSILYPELNTHLHTHTHTHTHTHPSNSFGGC